MLPKHVFGQGDIRTHANANQPIGTGPFKFVEWRRGELVRLDKNPDYWRKGLPYLDRVVVRFINDEATRTAALEKGEAHVAGFGGVPYNDAKKLATLPSIEVTTKGYEMISPVVELVINTKKAPFDNQKVRQAVAYAVDRQFVIDNIWFGFGKPATGPISSNFAPSGLYTADVTKYQVPDGIEQGQQAARRSRFPQEGRRHPLRDRARHHALRARMAKRFGEFVQQRLALVGIKASLRYEDVATWLKRVYTDYDFISRSNFLYNLPDPVLGVHRAIHGKLIKQGTVFVNGAQWSDPRSDELMDKATVEPDLKKRAEYYHEVQKIVVEGSPIVWVFELNFPTVDQQALQERDHQPARALHQLRRGLAGLASGHAIAALHGHPGLCARDPVLNERRSLLYDRIPVTEYRDDKVRWAARWLLRYVVRRLLQAIPVVLGVVVLNFLLLQLAPGDAATVLAGEAGGAPLRVHSAAARAVRPRPACAGPARAVREEHPRTRSRLLVSQRQPGAAADPRPPVADAAADGHDAGALRGGRRAARAARRHLGAHMERPRHIGRPPSSPMPCRCSGSA